MEDGGGGGIFKPTMGAAEVRCPARKKLENERIERGATVWVCDVCGTMRFGESGSCERNVG